LLQEITSKNFSFPSNETSNLTASPSLKTLPIFFNQISLIFGGRISEAFFPCICSLLKPRDLKRAGLTSRKIKSSGSLLSQYYLFL